MPRHRHQEGRVINQGEHSMVNTPTVRFKDAKERIYEQNLATQADVREIMAYLSVIVLKANREGRECIVEVWSEVIEPKPSL